MLAAMCDKGGSGWVWMSAKMVVIHPKSHNQAYGGIFNMDMCCNLGYGGRRGESGTTPSDLSILLTKSLPNLNWICTV